MIVYVLAMAAANLIVWKFGPWISPLNAFVLIGLDLTLRDMLHDSLTRRKMLGLILAGGTITLIANPAAGQVALASAVAFTVSALADWATYARLRAHPWLVRSNGSNVVGAAVDSIIFPTLAFGILLPQIIALQFFAKVLGGAVWAVILRKPRLLGSPLR
jgi:hypothetical protein